MKPLKIRGALRELGHTLTMINAAVDDPEFFKERAREGYLSCRLWIPMHHDWEEGIKIIGLWTFRHQIETRAFIYERFIEKNGAVGSIRRECDAPWLVAHIKKFRLTPTMGGLIQFVLDDRSGYDTEKVSSQKTPDPKLKKVLRAISQEIDGLFDQEIRPFNTTERNPTRY